VIHATRFLGVLVAASTLAVLGGAASAQSAPPSPIDRSGFTGELDLGFGFTHLSADGFESQTKGGLSGINFQLGGFVSPTTAVNVRVSGTTFSGNTDMTFVNGMLGLTVQHFVTPKISVGGGAGFGILTTTGSENNEGDRGLAINARATYDVWQSHSSAIQLGFELMPVFYDDGTATSVGFQIGWQHY
jgi:hypothetical protein